MTRGVRGSMLRGCLLTQCSHLPLTNHEREPNATGGTAVSANNQEPRLICVCESSLFAPPHTSPLLWVTMAEVEKIEENIANEVRAGAVVSTMSHAVHEREDAPPMST